MQHTQPFKSSIRDIKKMFATEHVIKVVTLFGVLYYNAHTKEEMSEQQALKYLQGDY